MNNGLYIEQFKLLERWDMPVATTMDIDSGNRLEKYEMYATIESYENKYGQSAQYKIKSILEMLKKAKAEEADLVIVGVLPFEVMVEYEDIMSLEPELSGIIALVEALNEEITIDKLVEKIGDMQVIFLGEYPDVNKGGKFGVHTVKHVKEEYEMIPVFLNKENAKQYNKGNHPLTETTINELKRFYSQFAIIVEPHKKYWAIIEPERV